MARKSRAVVETVKAKFRVWRIAIYIRLSKEDARCLDESESVTNQRAIIEDHIAGFNDRENVHLSYSSCNQFFILTAEIQNQNSLIVQISTSPLKTTAAAPVIITLSLV